MIISKITFCNNVSTYAHTRKSDRQTIKTFWASNPSFTSAKGDTYQSTISQKLHNGNIAEKAIINQGFSNKPEAEKLLSLLKSQDKQKAVLLNNIFKYWSYVNNDMVINTKALPSGLPEDNSLGIAILGYELTPDGKMSKELLGRLNAGLLCAKKYPNAYVILSGGHSAKNRPDVSEGDLMEKWLVKNGIDKKRIIIEDKSLNTLENAKFVNSLLRKSYPQINSLAIISSYNHIPRSCLLFEALLQKENLANGSNIHVVSNYAYTNKSNILPEQNEQLRQIRGLLMILSK
ncbi:MAG: YdcF family protein [bacterium]|nr:YdcF family protein [bacterium]